MLPVSPVPHGDLTQARIEGLAENAVPGDVAVELEHWDTRGWFIDVTFGVLAVLAGLAGLVLPFLPGWAPIIGGIVLLAGRIPPLRRWLSRIIMLAAVQRFFDRMARNQKMRKLMAKALLRKKVRDAVEPSARREIVGLLVRNDAEEGASNTDAADSGDMMI